MNSLTSQLPAMNPAPAVQKSVPAPVVHKKSNKTKWFVLGGIVLVVGLGTAVYFKNKNSDKGFAITTEKAVTKTITQLVNATGKIQPEVEVKIAPEVSGEIIELPLREGAVVKKGDLLVKIKADAYKYQVEQQEANLVAAKATAVQMEASLLKAKDDLKRADDLFNKKLISDSDYLSSKTSVDIAQA